MNSDAKVIAVGSNMKFFRYKEIDFWLGITASIAPYNVQKSLSKHGIENLSKNALMWTMNAESQLCQNSSAAKSMGQYILKHQKSKLYFRHKGIVWNF